MRDVPMTIEDLRLVEEGAYALLRAGDVTQGFTLAGLALKWRYQFGFGGELEAPTNLVHLHDRRKESA